jgi:hypothetical protein
MLHPVILAQRGSSAEGVYLYYLARQGIHINRNVGEAPPQKNNIHRHQRHYYTFKK